MVIFIVWIGFILFEQKIRLNPIKKYVKTKIFVWTYNAIPKG